MQQIVKYSRGRVIKYNQMHNKQGTLTRIPTAKMLKQCAVHMCKKDTFLEEVVSIISESKIEPTANAAECLCNAVCQQYEDAFASVTEKEALPY